MEAEQDFNKVPFDALKVARDVHSALLQFGIELPAPQSMAADARRLAAACAGHAWRDREAEDFIQEFAKRVWARQGKRALDWNLYVRSCFRLMGQGRDAGGERRVRGAGDIDGPVGKDGEGTLTEVIAAPAQERRAELDEALPDHVEAVADLLRDAPSKTISKARGVTGRQGRYDTQKLIKATALAVRDPGLFPGVGIDPGAWASRAKRGRGGRPSKAALAQRQAAQARQAGLF
ncbi:MAG: hypothetical protein ACYCSN_13110 [Acidobacteriaceae bacterium]